MLRQSLCLRLISKWFELWMALMKSHLKLNWIHRGNGIHFHLFLIGTLDLVHAKQSEKKNLNKIVESENPCHYLHASQTHKIPTRLIFNVFVLCFPLDFRNDSGFSTQIASTDRSNSNGDIYKDLHSTWVFNQNYSNQIFPITYSSYDISIVNANQIQWRLIEQWETRRHLFSSVRWSWNRLIFCTNKHLFWLTFVAGCWWWQCSILYNVHALLVLNDMHPWFDFHGSNRHRFQWLLMTMTFLMEFSLYRSPFFVQTNKNVYSFLFLFLFFR